VKPTVVFLHGLARSHRSLASLRRAVERAGYPTWARSYPSRRLDLAALADWLAQSIREDLGERPLFGVTHSLGGVLVRHLAQRLPWRGVVMLAPPNQGSRVAAAFKDNPVFRWYFGPAGQQIERAEGWPAPPGWLIRGLRLLPPDEPSDGTVAVSETRLEGMADFATVAASHAWIMNHPQVPELVLGFLERGRFPPPR
jgi:pimeloyl-ACP methyl ester carboxylesterase